MSQPNALHKNMLRPNYLTVGQEQSTGLIFIFAFAAVGAVALTAYFGFSIPWYLQLHQGVTAFKLQVLTGLVVLLLLLVSIVISFTERRPTTFRVQTYSLWPRILWNLLGALFFLMLSATLLMMVYEYYLASLATAFDTPEGLKDSRKAKIIAFLMASLILLAGGLVTLWFGRTGLRNLRVFWQQVQLTGYFDQESYQPGDPIKFMLKDRKSLHGSHQYRVHLNFVTEKMQGKKDSQRLVREIQHASFQDCSAGELHMGIEYVVPEGEHTKWHYTSLANKELPQYWEILIEGEKPFFFARFFVNVTKPTPLTLKRLWTK